MSIKETLILIKETVDEISKGDSFHREEGCSKIESLLGELRIEGEPRKIPLTNFEEYAGHLMQHCRAIAGLEDCDGHTKQQHLAWAYGEINRLRSKHCFNVM